MSKFFKKSVLFLLALVTVLSLLPVHHADAASMKQGSKGTTVKQLQQNLIGLGYLNDSADGSYGSKTRKAVEAFQADFGLKADGTAGEATQTAIYNAVVRLQVELKNAGYAPGTADGHFGSKTRAALEKFQKDEGLDITGEMNKATWAAMDRSSLGIRGGAAARTAEQKREMKGKPIDLNGYKDKDFDFGKEVKDAVQSPAGQTFERVGGVFLGILLLLAGFGGLIGCSFIRVLPEIVSYEVAEEISRWGTLDAEEMLIETILTDTTFWSMVMVIVGLLCIWFIYNGVMLLFNLKAPSWKPGLVIFIAWIISIFVFAGWVAVNVADFLPTLIQL